MEPPPPRRETQTSQHLPPPIIGQRVRPPRASFSTPERSGARPQPSSASASHQVANCRNVGHMLPLVQQCRIEDCKCKKGCGGTGCNVCNKIAEQNKHSIFEPR